LQGETEVTGGKPAEVPFFKSEIQCELHGNLMSVLAVIFQWLGLSNHNNLIRLEGVM
jgi:hypothetical protein